MTIIVMVVLFEGSNRTSGDRKQARLLFREKCRLGDLH